jgi:predicted nucleic acid-binding Zn ribbon protein
LKKAADILHVILKDKEADRARNWSSFFRGWKAIAGEDLAAHSSVRDVKQGAVLVDVDHPGWMQMLQLKKAGILKDIKKHYPELEIRDVRCFLKSDPTAVPGSNVTGKPTQKPEPDENTEEYQEFKELLERLRNQGEEA